MRHGKVIGTFASWKKPNLVSVSRDGLRPQYFNEKVWIWEQYEFGFRATLDLLKIYSNWRHKKSQLMAVRDAFSNWVLYFCPGFFGWTEAAAFPLKCFGLISVQIVHNPHGMSWAWSSLELWGLKGSQGKRVSVSAGSFGIRCTN